MDRWLFLCTGPHAADAACGPRGGQGEGSPARFPVQNFRGNFLYIYGYYVFPLFFIMKKNEGGIQYEETQNEAGDKRKVQLGSDV